MHACSAARIASISSGCGASTRCTANRSVRRRRVYPCRRASPGHAPSHGLGAPQPVVLTIHSPGGGGLRLLHRRVRPAGGLPRRRRRPRDGLRAWRLLRGAGAAARRQQARRDGAAAPAPVRVLVVAGDEGGGRAPHLRPRPLRHPHSLASPHTRTQPSPSMRAPPSPARHPHVTQVRARTDATLLTLERDDFHRLLGPLVPQLQAAAASYKGYVASSTRIGKVRGSRGTGPVLLTLAATSTPPRSKL